MNEWKKADNKLEKEFVLKDFNYAIRFLNDVAAIAEKQNHHPDMNIHSYNKLNITLTTHSEGKITMQDEKMSQLIDEVFENESRI